MFRMDMNRRVAVLAVIVVLSLGRPLAAAGWEMSARWVSSGDFLKGFTLVLNWLGVAPARQAAPQCDQGSSIDPNGVCLKALRGDQGMGIDPNDARGAVSNAGAIIDGGSSIHPHGSY